MANLPQSGQADSIDSLTVTREQFRLQQKDLLEFLAQALGNVSGSYGTQTVDPLALTLQGTPTLAASAEPTATEDGLRLVTARWVRRYANSASPTPPLNPTRGQLWIDNAQDPPVLKIWDDTPAPGNWSAVVAVPDATTVLKGIVQLADAAAVAAGTAGRVVDAAQLKEVAAKAGGATGGGTDKIFYENDQVITTNYTLPSGKNAVTAGPVTINSGVVITIPANQSWSIV